MHTAKGSSRERSEREGKGKCRALPAVAWSTRLSATRSAPGFQGPWLVSAAPHTRRQTPWAPSSCLTHVACLALSSPAETCAAGWGQPLRAWAPAHSPSSVQAAPEPRPAGGAERPRLESECTTGGEASLLEGRGGSRAACGSSPAWLDPSAPPGLQSSSSAQRPDVAELLSEGCPALAEPCPDLPLCSASCPGRSRLREAGRRHWRLPGRSYAPALPLHLGPRRPWGGLRGRWLAHCQGLQQGALCEREGKGMCRAPPAVAWPP